MTPTAGHRRTVHISLSVEYFGSVEGGGRVSDSLTAAAAGGSRTDALAALRDLLALELVNCDGRGVAALAHELRETLKELDSMRPAEVSAVDDVAARRAKRLADAKAL